MHTYIAILRGINVGGKRRILMPDLKSLFADLGYQNIITYIQSGNVIFQTPDNNSAFIIANKIENEILEKFNLNVPIIIKSFKEFLEAIQKNPFYKTDNTDNTDIEKLHLTFLNKNPTFEKLQSIEGFDFSPDKFKVIDNNVFIYCEGKYHRSKLTNAFFEKKLNTNCSTRNWKTILKIAELASEINCNPNNSPTLS